MTDSVAGIHRRRTVAGRDVISSRWASGSASRQNMLHQLATTAMSTQSLFIPYRPECCLQGRTSTPSAILALPMKKLW